MGYRKEDLLFPQQKNVFNAWQLVNKTDEWVKKHLNITGLRIKKELMGTSCLPLELVPQSKKSIITSRSFGTMIESLSPMKEAISTFASKCAFKLRKQESNSSLVTIFLLTNRHRKELKQYNKSIAIRLQVPSNSTIEIVATALQGLQLIYKNGFKYKKAGVMVTAISPQAIIQTSLFDEMDRLKQNELMKTLDYTNFKIGRERVKLAACGSGRKWKLKQERISNGYTTRWDEIIRCS